jgi:HD-GYP domain-containing protein (c-di-GMP phosphodiesterase class II)
MPFIPMTIHELRIGLYIKLECSWWNHPFAKSKFKISSAKEIKTIKGIPKVKLFYDPELSDPEEAGEGGEPQDVHESVAGVPTQEECERKQEEIRTGQIQACEDHTAELQKASYLYQQVLAQTKIALKRISDGHAAGIKSADQVVSTLIHSLSMPETSMAIIDVLTSAETEDRFVTHALNVCIVSLLVGKEYHLEDNELNALALAGLLHDIGKQNFPVVLRSKRSGLTKIEQQDWMGHPNLGKGAAARFPSIPESTVRAIYQHHERLDGSGFPLGLKGDDISFFAKIVMAADEYDHLCHQPVPSKNLTPAEALSYLYDHYIVEKLMAVSDAINTMLSEDADALVGDEALAQDGGDEVTPMNDKAELSEEVIVYMVRALGVYPPGSLVELNNGSVGLVTGVNSEERTKPCVMICSPQTPRKEARVVDLTNETELAIVHSIRPQNLPKDVHDYIYSGRSA